MSRPAVTLPSGLWMPTRAGERRSLAAISGPLIAAYLVEMAMLIIDMIIVGRLGSIELAAVGLAADWFYVLLLIGMGVVSMVAVLVAHGRGVGDRDGMTTALEQGLLVATIFSVPVMLLTWSLGPLLALAGQDPGVVAAAHPYAQALTFGVPAVLWFTVLRNYITAVEKPLIIFQISLLALALNAGLNYALVFGRFGLPALGVFGAGLGTTIVSWLMLLVLVLHVRRTDAGANVRWARAIGKPDSLIFREIVVLGLPVAGTQLLSGGMFTVAAVLIGRLSATELAAQQIVYTVIYVSLSVAAGLGDAVRVRVAFGMGKSSPPAARQAAGITLQIGLIALGLAAMTLWFAPESIVRLFLRMEDAAEAAVLSAAVVFSVYAGLFQLFIGVQLIAANAMRGLKDTRTPMWFAILGYWLLGLGSGTALCFGFGFGSPGMWWGMTGGVAVSSMLMARSFFHRMQQETERMRSDHPPHS